MKLTHSGVTYECETAVKCENDKYIKLYDASGVEIASFIGIADFSAYSISGGSFIDPCNCSKPIPLSTYAIGGRTIATEDWLLASNNKFYYEIKSDLISENKTTCNVALLFAEGTELEYTTKQEAGKIVLYTDAAPLADVIIESIQITRV